MKDHFVSISLNAAFTYYYYLTSEKTFLPASAVSGVGIFMDYLSRIDIV